MSIKTIIKKFYERGNYSTLLYLLICLVLIGFFGTLVFLSGKFKNVDTQKKYLKIITENKDTVKLKVDYLNKFPDSSGRKIIVKDSIDDLVKQADFITANGDTVGLKVKYLNEFIDPSQINRKSLGFETDNGDSISLKVDYISNSPEGSVGFIKFISNYGDTSKLKVNYITSKETAIVDSSEKDKGNLEFVTDRGYTIKLTGIIERIQTIDDVIPSENLLLNTHPGLFIWSMLISAMIGLTFGLFLLYICFILYMYVNLNFKWLPLIVFIFMVFICGKMFHYLYNSSVNLSTAKDFIQWFGILFIDSNILEIVSYIIVTISLIGIIPLLMIPMASDSIKSKLITGKIIKKTDEKFVVEEFIKLDSIANYCLYGLATVIAISVLATGIMRTTILETVEIKGLDILPPELSHAYGFFFSVFLASIYVPVRFYMKSTGKEMFKDLKDQAHATSIKSILDPDRTALSKMKDLVAILSPLLISFIPNFTW